MNAQPADHDLAETVASAPEVVAADLSADSPPDEWRRLSRRMLLIHPVTELVRALPALIGVFLAGTTSGGGQGPLWTLGIAGVVMLFSLTRWFTTRLRITPQKIQLRHGLFRRQTKTAPLDRVRTVDVTAHLLHRALGLAKVAIGTGTSDRKGGGRLIIDGLPEDAAHRLRDELLHRTPATAVGAVAATAPGEVPGVQTVEAEETLLDLDPHWVRYAPFTLSGAIAGAALLAFGWRIVNEGHVNLDRIALFHDVIQLMRRNNLALVVVAIVLIIIVFVAMASTVGYVLAFWQFRLTRHSGGTLRVTRGLITSRATSIERRRLHGIEVSEPLLLRAVGGARCLAVATGLRVGKGGERGGELLVPPAPRDVVDRVAARILETPAPLDAELAPHSHAALRRRQTRAILAAFGLVALSAVIWTAAGWGWGWLGWLVLVAAAVPLANDRYRSLGHALSAGYLVTRFGSLARRRCVVATEGIIGWNVRSSYFQRRLNLVTLTATTAAGKQRYRITDMAVDEAAGFAATVTPGLLEQFRT